MFLIAARRLKTSIWVSFETVSCSTTCPMCFLTIEMSLTRDGHGHLFRRQSCVPSYLVNISRPPVHPASNESVASAARRGSIMNERSLKVNYQLTLTLSTPDPPSLLMTIQYKSMSLSRLAQ